MILGDSAIHQILRSPKLGAYLPELTFAARILQQIDAAPMTGCRSCSAGRRIRQATELAKQKIMAMPPARLAELKKVLGVSGSLKIFTKQGTRIVPVVV